MDPILIYTGDGTLQDRLLQGPILDWPWFRDIVANSLPMGKSQVDRAPTTVSSEERGDHNDQTSPSPRDCTTGHWCKSEATSKDPTDGAQGLLCPAGHYCLEVIPIPRVTSTVAG